MDQRSVREQEDDELYFEAYDDMVKSLVKRLIVVSYNANKQKQTI